MAIHPPRQVAFPAPFNLRRAYVFPFSDQVLYPRTMGARTVITRLSIDPPRINRLLSMLAGMGATGVLARPRVRAALGRLRERRRPAEPAGPYALRVDVRFGGRIGTATLTGQGQAHATASGAAALIRSLADEEVVRAGAWMPEQVIDPGRFIDRLARRDLHVASNVAADQ